MVSLVLTGVYDCKLAEDALRWTILRMMKLQGI